MKWSQDERDQGRGEKERHRANVYNFLEVIPISPSLLSINNSYYCLLSSMDITVMSS